MLVDYERAWLDLKAAMEGRQGIGANALLALMGQLETTHRVEEGLPERALRLFGVVLSDDLIRGDMPAPRAPHAASADGDGPALMSDGEKPSRRSQHGTDSRARTRRTRAAAGAAAA